MQPIKVKLLGIDLEFNSGSAYTPVHFSRTLPLRGKMDLVRAMTSTIGALGLFSSSNM